MRFKRFDVVSDDSDHFYANTNRPISNGVHKKIMQEWRILEKNLPDSIAVRVYENRMDLLRAAMVGAAGTPYHDGLFFFDLSFPEEYPERPPLVHYHSFGLRINPNLYSNGKVCLSLVNTWMGKKSEKWNPAQSTVLQLLLSIQALVLNDKPFYNEPGMGKPPSGSGQEDKRSDRYNERAFALSCYTMLYLLRRPPKHFEALVVRHFRERSGAILAACGEYANGRARIGGLRSEGRVRVTGKFKGWMRDLYPALLRAFRKTGASLGDLAEELEMEMEMELPAKKKGGFMKFVIGMVKKVFGKKKSKTLDSAPSSSST